jgi:CubicO group peptidase (beta-lactamase class C family)
MEQIIERLEATGPAISQICKLSGTPGASIGVLHDNEVIYTAGFGYRDVEAKLAPDENTIYHIASLTKAFTAAAIGVLVHEKKITWDTPIAHVMPEFRHPDRTIAEETNLVDLLSHRVGVATQDSLWSTEHGRLKFNQDETVAMFATLPRVRDFRSKFGYCNWGYGLATVLLEKVAGKTLAEFLHAHFVRPLGLERTFLSEVDVHNQGEAYVPLLDGTLIPQKPPFIASSTVMSGAAGIRSCVKDLLVFYKSLLNAATSQFSHNTTSEDSPFKEAATLLSAHVSMGESLLENSYALGWIRTELPGRLGAIGTNGGLVDEMPTVGRGSKSRLVISHSGSLSGFSSAVVLLPETNSAIVVLTNSISKNDCADWLSQLLLETLIDNYYKNDYVELARISARNSDEKIQAIPKILAEKQVSHTSHRTLTDYVGRYYNSNKLWWIDVWVENQALYFSMKGPEYPYKLTHYDHDTFSWILSRDELVRLGRFPNNFPPYYLINFNVGEGGVTGLSWHNDRGIKDSQTFVRQGEDSIVAVPPNSFHALPRRSRLFKGRSSELAQVHAYLRRHSVMHDRGHVSICVLHGLAGTGKTETAIEYCYLFADTYESIFWIDNSEPSHRLTSLRTLSTYLGNGVAATEADLKEALMWSNTAGHCFHNKTAWKVR